MTRKEQIEKGWIRFALQSNHKYDEKTFKEAVEWADENPDTKRIYAKKQLMDMGFSFTTNGDIVTPDQLNEDLKKYLKYQKQKFIEKACKWLKDNMDLEHDYPNSNEELIEDFRKAMEE